MKISSQQIGRGKLGNAIYAQVGGECIARQYQPNVSNPSTTGQVEQRAKMKLITQLGAVLSPVLAFRKSGLVSARNKFVSRNIGATYYSEGAADVRLVDVKLTDGSIGIGALNVTHENNEYSSIALFTGADPSVSRVAYFIYTKTSQGILNLARNQIVERDSDARFTYAPGLTTNLPVIIYAYGMCDLNQAATAKYNSMQIQSATMLAKLIASRTLSPADYRMTDTISWASQDTPVPTP